MIGATAYIECSAYSHDGVREVFEETIRSIRSDQEKCGLTYLLSLIVD